MNGLRSLGGMAIVQAAPLLAAEEWALDVIELLLVPALVVLNGVFVAAEFALVAVRKTQIEELVAQGSKGAKAAEAAINRLDRSIAATQLGITLASIGLGWIGEPALAALRPRRGLGGRRPAGRTERGAPRGQRGPSARERGVGRRRRPADHEAVLQTVRLALNVAR